MKQPHKSWACSAEGNDCIGRVRRGEGLELLTETKILCSWAWWTPKSQNVVIDGLLCSARSLIYWEAWKCRISFLNNRIMTKSDYQDTPCLMGGPDWFLRLHFSPAGHNLPKATEQWDFTTKYCKDLSSERAEVLPLPTKTFNVSQSFFP